MLVSFNYLIEDDIFFTYKKSKPLFLLVYLINFFHLQAWVQTIAIVTWANISTLDY